MANIDQMQTALDKLINAGALPIPGLDYDTVVNNLIQVKYKEELDKCPTESERKAAVDSLLEYYKKNAKDQIMREINTIKSAYSSAVAQSKYVKDSIAATIAASSIPSVITTGSAVSVPNPVYGLIENKQKKNSLLAILEQLGKMLIDLLHSAIAIAFEIPDTIITLIDSIVPIKSALMAIPV
jgi:hypothetical protein